MMKLTTILRSTEKGLSPRRHHALRGVLPGILATVFLAATLFPTAAVYGQGNETVELEAGFYYTIKKDDTLWDLSQRFADNPWLWPDLWQKNGQIANPHRIYPGERIRIYHKDWIERIRQEPVAKAPEPEPVVMAKAQEPKPEPVTDTITYAAIDSVGFIREKKIKSYGTIFKVKDDQALISQDDLAYIHFGEGTLEVGSKYLIFKALDPLRDKQTKKLIGIQHYILGIIKILGIENEFALGEIYRSFEAIKIGDQLMSYVPGNPKISLTESVKGLKGRILAADEGEQLIGDSMLVFLDKGSLHGVARGQRYLIYRELPPYKSSSESKKPLTLPPIDFGSLLVLHVEDTTATALILSTHTNIKPGDAFRAPH